jgi:outer membrane receptor protein involved in Fe transport
MIHGRAKCVFWLLILLCAGATTQQCLGQFNSSVQGTVSDQTGALVTSATVTLHNTQTGVEYSAPVNGSGFYRFNSLAPGSYQIFVDAPGFARQTIDTLVTTDQTAGVNIRMAPASTLSTVSVTSQGPVLNPDETRNQTTIEAQQIQNVPLQNGSILELTRVAPGVTGIDEDRNLSAIGIIGNSPVAGANGRPSTSNLYLLDGATIQSNSLLYSSLELNFVPNPDMVSEVSLETTTFAVDNGAGSSLRVNYTSKAGTNRFHGAVTYRYGGKGLDAVPDFTSALSPFSRRWWLASLGGPIWKDRTFFFVSFLHQNQISSSSSVSNYTAPEFIQWAHQNYPNSLDVNDLLLAFPADKITHLGTAVTANQGWAPSSNGVCTVPVNAAPFGTQIGSTPIPCSLPVLDSGIFNQAPTVIGHQIDARLDQYFRQGKDRIYASFIETPQTSNFLWWHSGYDALTPSVTRYGNLNYTHIFSSQLLNRASFVYQRYGSSFTPSPAATIPFLSLILGPGPTNPGTDFFGTPGDSYSKAHDYMFRNDVVWTHHDHNVSLGFQYTHNDTWDNSSGEASKPSTPIYNTWSDFLDDQPFTYGLSTLSAATGKYLPQIYGSQVTQFSAYAQDEWRATPRLLLTLGIRWDDYGNPYAYGNGALPFAQIFPAAGSTLQQQIAGSSVQAVKNAFAGRLNNNFLPRIGFAWTPKENGKWVVHGGIGFYEDSLELGDITQGLPQQPPVDLSLTFSVFSPAPLNNVTSANLYGTSASAPPPYGRTYINPAITPLGFDSRGGVIASYNGGSPILYQASLNGNDRHLTPQKSALFNLAVEHQLSHNIVVGAIYTGSNSWNQWYGGDFNTFPGDLIVNNGTEERLTSEWGAINLTRNGLRTNYNGVTLTARQTGRPFTWQASYTYSRSLGDPLPLGTSGNAGLDTLPNAYTPNSLYGPSDYDVPQSFNGLATYNLALHSNNWLLDRALGGWQIGGVVTGQEGTPFSVITTSPWSPGTNDPRVGGDYLANGTNFSYVNVPPGTKRKGFSRAQYKQGIFAYAGYTPTTTAPADAPYFTNPAGYGTTPVLGNQGRNSFRNPGYLGLDASVHKSIDLPWFRDQKSVLMAGAEATNVINRANLGTLNNNSNSINAADLAQGLNFGIVNTANQARIIQLVARFSF